MTFLHDSTPGLNGQNPPSNSVKAPSPFYNALTNIIQEQNEFLAEVVTPGLNGQETAVSVKAADARDPLFFMGGTFELTFELDEDVSLDEWTVSQLKKFSSGTGLTQTQIPQFLQFLVDGGHYTDRNYRHLLPTWELVDEFVAQDQANAYSEAEAVHFAGQYPVMDFPAIDAGIKAQLDRMEALLFEIKAGFTFNPQGLE